MKPSTFLGNVQRFWSNVDRTGPCWAWLGETNNHGYGRFEFWHDDQRTRVFAHRMSLILIGVELGDAELVMHSCDNPPCVNPDHLSTGVQADNMHDAIMRGRLDMSGLSLGQSATWPPRPCRRCSALVTEGRRRYCPDCRRVVTRESHQRYRAKRLANEAS